MTTPNSVTLSFAQSAQKEVPLRAAAYNVAGFAACDIDVRNRRWVCSLTPAGKDCYAPDVLKQRFLAVLNDENLREQLEQRVAPVRDVILALAFGALVRHAKADT